MRLRILAIYITAFLVLFMCSCSEIADTPAKELRSCAWSTNGGKNYSADLSFRGDDAILKIKDNNSKKEYKFTGTTIVTDKEITIKDKETLSEYTFEYNLRGDSVTLISKGNKLRLNKSNSKTNSNKT